MQLPAMDLRIVPQDAVRQIKQLSDHFRAGEPPAGDNERELTAPLLWVHLDIGTFQQRNDVVAQPSCVREALQGKGKGLKTREAVEGGHRADRQNEIVVGEGLDRSGG